MEPGIYRAKLTFESNFVTIPNDWIRGTGLTVNANFLLVYLMTHEIGYNITFGQIAREIRMGQTAIRSAANELKKAGWLETQRTHDERGFNSGLAWILTQPGTNPDLGNPDLANPSLDWRATYREYKDIKNTKEPRTYAQETETAFENFWQTYPRKTGKAAAKRAFVKALATTARLEIMSGVHRLAADPNLPPKQFIPHPATWLNEGRWDDEPYPARDTNQKDDNRAKAAAILRELGERHG